MVTRPSKIAQRHLFITEWMERVGLNDEQLGARMGKDRATIWRWRNQQNRLDPDKIVAIARALDCEPIDLWRRPSARPSLDALIKDASQDLQDTAADIVQRLVNKS